MRYTSRFNLLFEEIMKATINVDTFNFQFEELSNSNIKCIFDASDINNNVLTVTAEIDVNGVITFNVRGKDVTRTYDEKQFMTKFYKDYKHFKAAYSDFLNKKNEPEEEDLNKYTVSSDNNLTIPGINSFTEKLNELDTKNNGINIRRADITFTFRLLDDKINNLIQCNFDLINNEPQSDELSKYSVVSIIKLTKSNSIPVKFILNDPENNEKIETLTGSQFKEKFKRAYELLHSAVSEYKHAL